MRKRLSRESIRRRPEKKQRLEFTPNAKLSTQGLTYSKHETNNDQAKVETLLCRSSSLFSCRKFVPRDESIIVECSHAPSLRAQGGRSAQSMLRRISSRYQRLADGVWSDQVRRRSYRDEGRGWLHSVGYPASILQG